VASRKIRQPEIRVYIGNRKKVEEWSSVHIDSSVVQDDTIEPIRDKNRSRLALKRAFIWSRKRQEDV
jgi:hypothetical protein